MPLLRFWSHHAGIVSGRRAIARSNATNGRTVYTGSAAPIVVVSAALATLGSSTSAVVVANSRISSPPSFAVDVLRGRAGERTCLHPTCARSVSLRTTGADTCARPPVRVDRWTDAGTPSTGKWRGERGGRGAA